MGISAVVPTYNREDTIERSLRSVIQQSKPVDEIIVVDDASTDSTKRVISELDIANLEYIRHDVNKGPAAARNTGIDRATGDFVLFLDSDDELRPSATERLYEALTQAHRNCAGVFTHYEEKDEHGETSKIWNEATGNVTKDDLTKYLAIPTISGSLIRSSVLDRVNGFDERMIVTEDADLAHRISDISDLYVIDEILLRKYSDSENQLTNDENEKSDRLFVIGMNIFLEAHGEELENAYRISHRIDAGFASMRSIDNEAAKQHFETALAYASDNSERAFALQYIGRRYAHNGDTKTANRYFKLSLQYDRSQISVYIYLLISILGNNIWSRARQVKNCIKLNSYLLKYHLDTRFRGSVRSVI